MRATYRILVKVIATLGISLFTLISVSAGSASAIGTLSAFNFFDNQFPVQSITGSQDGKYLLAAGGGTVRVSSNYGSTWSSPNVVSAQGYHYFLTSGTSSDGRVMVVGGYLATNSTGAVFVSRDYGSTWNPVVSNYNFGSNPSQSVTVSGDGLTIYTADVNYERQMFKSTFTSGAWSNWSKLASSPTSQYSSITTNNDGQVIIASTSQIGVAYSRDFGATWALSNSVDQMRQWLDPNATSTSGLGLSINRGPQDQLWRTTNSGSTWTKITTVPAVAGEKFEGVSASNDGRRIYLNGSRGFYRSIDSGATWTTVDIGGQGDNNSGGPIFSAGTVVGNVVLYTQVRADYELATANFTVSLASQVQSLTGTAGNNQVALTWTAPSSNGDAPGITDYLVKYKASSDSAWTTFADGTKTTTGATVTGLTNGTAYTFNVVPLTIYGQGAESTSSSYTPATLPGAPGSVTATFGDRNVQIFWAAPTSNGGSEITQYSIQYQINGTGSFITFGNTATSTGRSLYVAGLTNGTSYKFKVAATNAMGSTFSGLTAAITPKGIPTFSWADLSKSYGDAGFSITSPTVTNSVLGTFTYASATTSVATISSSGAVALIAPGSTIITATFTPTNTSLNQSGGTVTTLLTVKKKAPIFNSFADISKTYGDSTFASTASISNSISGSLVYSSSNTDVATIASDGTVTILKAGTTAIQADFTPTDGTNNATGTASRSLTVAKKAQGSAVAGYFSQSMDYGSTFTFSGSKTVSITSGYSTGLTPVYSVASGNCAISGDKMTATSVGSCVVKGTIPGGDNYLDSSTNGTISVAKVYLDFIPILSQLTYGESITPSYGITGLKGSDSVLSVTKTYTGINSTVYGPSTTAPTLVGTYRADFSNLLLVNSKNSNYTIRYSSSYAALTIAKGLQSALTINQTTGTALTPIDLSISGGSSNGNVTYTLIGGPCTLSSNTLTPSESGRCDVKAKMAGDENYKDVTSSDAYIAISRTAQSALTIQIPQISYYYGQTLGLQTTGGSGSGGVTYQVVSGSCSINGSALSSSGSGNCVVTASKAADSKYLATTSSQQTKFFGKRSLSIAIAGQTTAPFGTVKTLTFTTDGLFGTDAVTISAVRYSGGPSASSLTFPSEIGTYDAVVEAIIFTSGLASNYEVSYVNAEASVKIVKSDQRPIALVSDSFQFGSNLTISTTGGDGSGAISVTVAQGNCAISGNILSNANLVETSGCILKIYKHGDNYFNESETIIVDVEVTKAPQAQLVITSLPMTVGVLTTPTVSGGSTSGIISLEVLSGPCVVRNLDLYGSEVGDCEVRASRDGLPNYQGVVSSTISVSVSKASQTIKIYTLSESKTQKNISPTIEVTSGLTPTITTADSAICSATGLTIFTVSEGICSFIVSQTGNSSYLAASPVSASFTINGKADPVISNLIDLSKNLGDQFFFNYGAIYNESNIAGKWVFTSSDSDVLTITSDSAVAKKGGSVFVTATFTPENSSSFNTASKTIEVRVSKGLQATLNIIASSVQFGVKERISITGGSTSGFVTYVIDSGNCSIVDGVLSSTSGGNCYLTATMAGNQNYESVSSASTLITISKIEQTSLAITSLYMNFGSTLTLVSTGGTGTGALSYVVDSGHCTVNGSTLTATEVDTSADSANDCYVIVTRAADASYTVKSAAKTKITISAGTQSPLTITSTTATFGASYLLATSGGSNSGSVSYVVTSGNCTVSGSTLTNSSAGICSVTATMASSDRYLAVSSAATEITISKAAQSALLISNATITGTYGGSIDLTSSGGNSGGSITYAVHSGHPCTISGSFLVPTAGGDCGVIATMSGGANYQNVSSSEVTFTFAKKAASITSLTLNKNIGSTIQSLTYQVIGFVNGDSITAVTTNYEGDTVTYALSTTVPDVAGLYKIKPSAAKLSTGADASTKYEITYTDGALTVYIGVQAPLVITSTSIDVLNILDLTTSGGSGTGAVTYTVNAGSCYIGGSQLVPTSGYDCQITATKAGDSEYGAISSESTVIRVIKIAQTLTFDAIADLPLNYLNAYANASSNRYRIVEYSSLTPAVCTSSSYLVDLVSVGTCTLAANQSGDEFVGPAAQVTRSFQITTPYVAPKTAQGPLYIFIPNSSPAVGDSVLVMPYGGTAGTPNVLTIATPNSNNCTLEAITDTQNYWLYAESAGTCRIVFNKMGDFLFDSATAVTADVVFAAPDISAFRVAIEIDSSVTPPSLSPDVLTQTIDQYGTIATVTFTNSGGAVDSYSYLDLPAGLSFDPITGTLSGKMSSVSFAFAFGITAINAGGSSMASTMVSFTPINRTISLNQPSDMNLGDVPQTLIATSSSMTSVNRFGSSTNATCTIFKGIVTAVAEGTCTITADLPGDQNYADAQQVSVSFTIFPVGGPSVPAPTPARTITYALGGGSGTVPTHTDVSEGNDFTVAGGSGLTRTGYTFNKWNDGTSNFSDGSIYTVATSNVLLTATWTANAPAPTPAPAPSLPVPSNPIATPAATVSTLVAPINPVVNSLVFAENAAKNGGVLSWSGTNIQSWRFIGDEKIYPAPYVYGGYTASWPGTLVNMVRGVNYTLSLEVLSTTGTGSTKSITYLLEGKTETEIAAEVAQKLAQETSVAEAKAIAEQKIAEEAALKAAAEKTAAAKTVEDARIAAEVKASAEQAAVELKAASDKKTADEAESLKNFKEKSEAESQAAQDAAAIKAALERAAAESISLAKAKEALKLSINLPASKIYLSSTLKSKLKKYAKSLKIKSTVVCTAYTYLKSPSNFAKLKAKQESIAVCKYLKLANKTLVTKVSTKSWLALGTNKPAIDLKKQHVVNLLALTLKLD